ncbi:hypothetical protein ACFSFZ_04125 [Mixta tenebrionis]|uniref:Tetratricopeptide repeat protein n=1 Tax=Mixta tenebrionis TaxID=2562439 RepID=A0A506VEW0_9GAMM|nr:hypothetical protein [Mixta tenebrionis]TPW44138.1 hypothetical protein FKM52_00010 [Mixta tenebrionis]
MREWNPVEQRFVLAHEDWLNFARNRSARLLYWRADEDDRQMVELYLQVRGEGSCTLIPLSHPFRSANEWLAEATRELIAYYQARQEGARQQGIVADWQPPHNQYDGVVGFFSVARSLMQHHPDIFPGLVFVIQPSHFFAPQQFVDALAQLLSHPFLTSPEGARIRFIVPESAVTPALDKLLHRFPALTQTINGRYQMRRVPGEVVANAGDRGPSGEFRRLYVQLGDTLRNNDMARMAQLRQQMLDITTEQGWPDQAAVVCLTAGVARLKSGQIPQAQAEYRQALQYARQAQEVKNPAGGKLIVNALFGEASVLLKNNELFKAAACYQVAAEQAQQDQDGILAVEGWRMRAWCLDKVGQLDAALDSAMSGLDAGLLIEPEMRAHSGLMLLMQWLPERLGVFSTRRKSLHQKLAQLFGEEWQQHVGRRMERADREV